LANEYAKKLSVDGLTLLDTFLDPGLEGLGLYLLCLLGGKALRAQEIQ
jgi:hypothetical protein